jgi:hypothetical protein
MASLSCFLTKESAQFAAVLRRQQNYTTCPTAASEDVHFLTMPIITFFLHRWHDNPHPLRHEDRHGLR